MAKERKINLPQTNGTFQLSGLVKGVSKEKFFTEKKTKTGKDMRIVHFGIETSKDSTSYIDLNGMVKDEVAFYKRAKEKGHKGETKKIKWANKDKFAEEGFKLIGINVGLSKKLDDKGKEVNDSKMYTEFDACSQINIHLKDDQSIFAKGKIEYGSFTNDDKVQRTIKFTPSQISLCKPIDFSDEKFEETSDFKQRIVFMGIEKDDSDKQDIKFVVSAKIVNYESIEEAEFVMRDGKLAQQFKKGLKPYSSIDVWGKIANKVQVEEVSEEDCWGEESKMDKAKNPTVRELVITGADPKTIDKETYSEAKFEEAVRALKEFGETSEGGWGSNSGLNNADEEEPWG